MWHNPGSIGGSKWIEPSEFWENADTKRRIHNLLAVSGLLDSLIPVRARLASREEILRFHVPEYHDRIEQESRQNGGDGGDMAPFSVGAYDIAATSAGGVLAAVEAIFDGKVDNLYCLVRPPGHHAERDQGRGFCLFNNVALGAFHAKHLYDQKGGMHYGGECGASPPPCKIAIVDYDVHHGNGTQQAFWDDPNVLFISIHQDSNYPVHSGAYTEVGGVGAEGTTINIPLPPGSGCGAYAYAFDTIVIPAVEQFSPHLVFVSSGFDASYSDPLAAMMLSSDAFREMAEKLIAVAERSPDCNGRVIFAHEGGYSKDYVPFCGVAVVEALLGQRSTVEDPCLCEVNNWGYQACQPHQQELINAIAMYHERKGWNHLAAAANTAAADKAAANAVLDVADTLTSAATQAAIQAATEAASESGSGLGTASAGSDSESDMQLINSMYVDLLRREPDPQRRRSVLLALLEKEWE